VADPRDNQVTQSLKLVIKPIAIKLSAQSTIMSTAQGDPLGTEKITATAEDPATHQPIPNIQVALTTSNGNATIVGAAAPGHFWLGTTNSAGEATFTLQANLQGSVDVQANSAGDPANKSNAIAIGVSPTPSP